MRPQRMVTAINTTAQMKHPNETLLWQQVREGDNQAYATVFSLYADTLLAYGMKFTTDRDLVKDTIQDLIIYIIRCHDRLPQVNNLKAYLLAAFRRNLQTTIVRSRYRLMDDDSELLFSIDCTADETAFDDADDHQLRRRNQLAEALETLPARQKEIIYLRFMQGVPMADIAQMLDMNYQSVRNSIHRTMQTLRSKIKIIYLFITSI